MVWCGQRHSAFETRRLFIQFIKTFSCRMKNFGSISVNKVIVMVSATEADEVNKFIVYC